MGCHGVYTVCTSEGVYVVLRAKPKELITSLDVCHVHHDTADLYLDHDQIRHPDSYHYVSDDVPV